ncbi:MAG: signal peptide peptidase SppA [Planctomycetes bacterium]|nr:signal peptide peptidase SppA [Planctomycetota bacterium]
MKAWQTIFILAFLFITVLMVNGCVFMTMDLKPKEDLEEVFVSGNQKGKEKILIIPIHGTILGEEDDAPRNCVTPVKIMEILNKATNDDNIKAIILSVDSPGGGVTASDRIYKCLKEFKKSHNNIPVVTLMKDTAASGGYYISMSSDYIIAHPTTITGSIGVISIFVTLEDLLQWAKTEVIVIKSGEMKDSGSPFRMMKPQEKEFFMNIIKEMYAGFVNIVDENRKELSLEKVKELADGRVYTGRQALDNKLVDAIGYQEDAVTKAESLAGITDAKVVTYKKPRGALESAFSIQSNSDIAQLKQILLQNTTTRFMYLWLPGAE